MNWKKVAKALLFPPIPLMVLLLVLVSTAMVWAMLRFGVESVPAILTYVPAAYTLAVWCVRIPELIRFFRTFREENKYARRWFEDERLRVNVSLYGSLVWNAAYAALQLWLGFLYSTFWFYSLAVYYIFLAVMRFFLVRHSRAYKPGVRMRAELVRYCACGWLFLLMNLALALIVFFMVYWNRTFLHDEITTIAMAAYTFTTLTVAIVDLIKYRKYQSPIYSASKSISLAAATVSLLTLASTMLTTFGDGTMDATSQKILLGTLGGAIVVFIVVMALYMIVQGTKKLKLLKAEENLHGKQ